MKTVNGFYIHLTKKMVNMTLQDFLRINVAQALDSSRHANWQKFGRQPAWYVYENTYFLIPRIYCNDGFNISIQVNNGNYCASENGYRKLGNTWVEAEWGFPSEHIDPIKYHSEDRENTVRSVGSCEIEILQELINEHNGIDYETTAMKAMEMTDNFHR